MTCFPERLSLAAISVVLLTEQRSFGVARINFEKDDRPPFFRLADRSRKSIDSVAQIFVLVFSCLRRKYSKSCATTFNRHWYDRRSCRRSRPLVPLAVGACELAISVQGTISRPLQLGRELHVCLAHWLPGNHQEASLKMKE